MKTVIKMGASWCRPCLQLKPIFDAAVAEIDNIKVVEVNVDDNPDIASNYKVRSIPTIIVTDDNDVVLASHSGVMSKEQIIDLINNC